MVQSDGCVEERAEYSKCVPDSIDLRVVGRVGTVSKLSRRSEVHKAKSFKDPDNLSLHQTGSSPLAAWVRIAWFLPALRLQTVAIGVSRSRYWRILMAPLLLYTL